MAEHHRQIDGLRCFAGLSIVVIHYFPADLYRWSPIVHVLGVPIFLVIGGYFATLILLKNYDRADALGVSRASVLWRFYARRLCRLMPLLLFAVLLMCAADVPGVRDTYPWHVLLATNLYLMAGGEQAAHVYHLWYLGVQEQCLLLLAVAMLWVPRAGVPVLMGVCVAASVLARAAFMSRGQGWEHAMVNAPTGWLDLVCAGGLLAWFTLHRPRVLGWHRAAWRALFWCSVVGFVVSRYYKLVGDQPAWMWILEPALLAPLCVWLVHAAIRGLGGPIGAAMSHPVAVYLGSISYGVYVYHAVVARVFGNLIARAGYPLGYVVDKAFAWTGWQPPMERGSWFTICLWSAATLALSVFSYHVVEAPMSSLKRRLLYVRQDTG